MGAMITRATSGWFRCESGILICGMDSVDLNEVVAIDAIVNDEYVEEGKETGVTLHLRNGGEYCFRRKYYKKYWELEINELFNAWIRTRKKK